MSDTTTGKHTAGPWAVTADENESETDGWLVVAADALFDTVANIEPQPTAGEELANARLIAAAPEMLEACRAVEFFLRGHPGEASVIREKLKALLAKATGDAA